MPLDQLPALSDEQRTVARKMGISEEAYARSAYAGKLNQERLVEKATKFGKLLQLKLEGRPEIKVVQIRLDVLQHRYEIAASEGERRFSFLVSEDMIDDLFQSGSENLEQNLDRVLNYALPARVA